MEVADAADPLGCVAALQLVTQLAQQAGPGGTALVGGSLLPALANLVQQADPLLSGRALQVRPASSPCTCNPRLSYLQTCNSLECILHVSTRGLLRR